MFRPLGLMGKYWLELGSAWISGQIISSGDIANVCGEI